MGIKLGELQGRRIFGQGVQVQLKEIYREFAVDVMEFVFIFAIVFLQMFFVHFFKVVQIVRALCIDTLMDDEVLAVLFMHKTVIAVRAS